MNKKAFTLVESIVALMVVAMIVGIAGLVIANAQQKTHDDYTVKVQEVIQDIESEKHSFRLVKLTSNQLTLYSQTEKKNYYLSCYAGHDMLRYTPGHMPLMLGVMKVFFEKDGKLIKMTITLKKDQAKESAEFYIPPKKES